MQREGTFQQVSLDLDLDTSDVEKMTDDVSYVVRVTKRHVTCVCVFARDDVFVRVFFFSLI